jgi:hypothetical protein
MRKPKLNLSVLLTLLVALMLYSGCKNSTKMENNSLMRSFSKSQAARDYKTSTVLLTQLFAMDSLKYAWAADTLAYYHFINAKFQSDASELSAAEYFVKEGLKINPESMVLNILDADVKLLNRRDTASLEVLQRAYSRGKAPEFMYYLAAASIATGRVTVADSLLNEGLSGMDSLSTSIVVQDELNRGWQKVPKKAVYLFLKANYVFNYEFNNDKKSAQRGIALLNECLRIAPEYTMAKAYYYQVGQQLGQRGF